MLTGRGALAQAEPEPECNGRKPWVMLVTRLPIAFAATVRSDLRAGLGPSNIQVCAEPPPAGGEPLARVVIEQRDTRGAGYSLDVTDSVTHKRVGRDLVLDRLPADGHGLALAVAAEELLRAAWAELALRGVHSPETAAPPEVRAIVDRAERPAAPARWFVAVGGRLAFEHFLGGQSHYGGDLFAEVPLHGAVSASGAVGARRGLAVHAPHGVIRSSALSAELALSLTLLKRTGLDIDVSISSRVLRLRFEAEAEPGVSSRSSHDWVVVARAGLGVAFGRVGPLRSYSALGAGLPLRTFEAADSGDVVSGASELELFASTGIALELP